MRDTEWMMDLAKQLAEMAKPRGERKKNVDLGSAEKQKRRKKVTKKEA